ncbi:hypothetical protein ACFPL7_14865 [Dongia soli]|uniref:Uncharacterized protein n=1 Tax=Dongia soli TaxID=600628 RepID=A0ABU5ED44_9PROT|nr:hypothetical protein [Dongia soli]MDY0883822.1 hypothetical protein [Dongia soli]
MILPRASSSDERIDATFRNGSITAVGILTGFSLGYVSQWVSDPSPWDIYDLLAVCPLILGVIMQVMALAALLSVTSLYLGHYNRAKKTFLIGLFLTAIGITIAVGLDITGFGNTSPPAHSAN